MDESNGRRGFGALVGQLVDESASLLRSEARLARIEAGRVTGAIARGTTLVALGSVLAILGTLAILVGLILLAGDQWLPADRYWLAALIVTAVTVAAAAVFARRGLAGLSPSRVAPVDTAATLKENAQWVTQQIKSATTSK
ncbi:MAG: phage holin family protein [Gemmatimonadaceae bacterium]